MRARAMCGVLTVAAATIASPPSCEYALPGGTDDVGSSGTGQL